MMIKESDRMESSGPNRLLLGCYLLLCLHLGILQATGGERAYI